MAYKRYPKRRGAKRRQAAKKPSTWTDLAKKVALGLSGSALIALKGKLGLNTETKYIDTSTVVYTATTTLAFAASNLTTPIVQGSASNQRSGATCRMTSMSLRGEIVQSAGNLVPGSMRVVIVNWGRSSNNDAPGLVLQDTTQIYSPRNLDSTVPFTILMDKSYYYQPTAAGDAILTRPFSFDYKPKNHHISWTDADTAGTAANCINGLVTIYIFCSTFTAGNVPTLTFWQRVKYVDN